MLPLKCPGGASGCEGGGGGMRRWNAVGGRVPEFEAVAFAAAAARTGTRTGSVWLDGFGHIHMRIYVILSRVAATEIRRHNTTLHANQ